MKEVWVTSRTTWCCLLENLDGILSERSLSKQRNQKDIEGMTVEKGTLQSRQHSTTDFMREVGPRAEILPNQETMWLYDFTMDSLMTGELDK